MTDRIEVENVNTPGRVTRVDAARYAAMRAAMLKVLPRGDKGLTAAQVQQAVKPHLPQELFPGGDKVGWWMKCVQLDLEAKAILRRHRTTPLTFSRT